MRYQLFSRTMRNWRQSAYVALLASTTVTGALTATAQTEPPIWQNPALSRSYPAVGIAAGVQSNFHAASFQQLPGVPSCCPQYESGSGSGFSISASYSLPIGTDLALQLRGGVSSYDGVLETSERQNIAQPPDLDQSVEALIEHRIESGLTIVSLEPAVAYYPWKLPIVLRAGIAIGALVGSTYSQEEFLASPATATFENFSVRRNQSSGDLPNAQTLSFGALLGAGYDLPLSAHFRATPEATYLLSFTDVVDGLSWNVQSLRIGVSAHYVLAPAPPTPPRIDPPEFTPDPILAQLPDLAPLLDAKLSVSSDFFGSDADTDFKLKVEETETRETLPLLPNIFFPRGSARLGETHQHLVTPEQANAFEENNLPTNALDFYPNTLNIIGKRLRVRPGARIVISGIISAFGPESYNSELATRRALAVKNYLVDIWGVKANNVRVRTKNVDRDPSSAAEEDILEENQRIEISSSTYEILAPAHIRKNSRIRNTRHINIDADVESEAGIRSWKLEITQNARSLAAYHGEGHPEYISWKLPPYDIATDEAPLNINLSVIDNSNQIKEVRRSIPISLLTVAEKRHRNASDKRIDNFSLTLFGFNETALSSKNKRILQQVISSVEPDSKVTVWGYADRTGADEYNLRLAEKRCEEVLRYLEDKIPTRDIAIRPIGSEKLLYDNATPQGRNYSRTVRIVIETPVKR